MCLELCSGTTRRLVAILAHVHLNGKDGIPYGTFPRRGRKLTGGGVAALQFYRTQVSARVARAIYQISMQFAWAVRTP